MKKILILGLLFISSTVFAAGDECSRQLDSMLYRTGEAARLDAAAIQHGLNIYTGEVVYVDKLSEAVPSLMKIASEHRDAIEKMKAEFKASCLK